MHRRERGACQVHARTSMLHHAARAEGQKWGSEWARLSALLDLWQVHYLKNGLLGAQVAIQHLRRVHL